MSRRGLHCPRKPKGRTATEPFADVPEKRQQAKFELICWAVLFAAAVGALVWKHYTVFFFSWTDEQIHFYIARRMVEGAVLYRDIDSARPPLVLFAIAWLMKLGFGPLLAGRTMVLTAQLATAGVLLWGGWRLAHWRVGALAALLFLTSPEAFSRVHYTGIHLVALTTSACVLFHLRAQPLRSGVFFGLTLAAGQHGLVIGGIVAVLTLIRRPSDGARFALGASIVTGIVFGGLWAMGSLHVWQSLFGHHLYHLGSSQAGNAQLWEKLTPWLYEHIYLFVGAGLAFAFLGAKRRKHEEVGPGPPSSVVVRVLLLVLGAHVAVVLAMTDSVSLYIVVIAPVLTLLAAMGYDAAVAWWRQRSHMPRTQARRASELMLTGAVTLVAVTAAGWAAARAHREGLDERQYSFWPHVRHGQVSRSQSLDPAVRAIADSMLPKTGTIFGDPTIVTAVALHSGLRVSGELADLNPTWLDAGTVKPEDVVSRIESDGVSAVISPPFGLVQNPTFKKYLLTCYEKPKPFLAPESGPGSGLPFFMVFTHKLAPCNFPSEGLRP
jgi:hypothetical protein